MRDYIRWAEDSWLMCVVPVFSNSHKEQERNYKKIYSIDWALAMRNSPVWDGSFSQALENLVYLHLRRTFSRVFFYLTRTRRREVDFVALNDRGRPAVAVQVCFNLSDPRTLEREIVPLETTVRYFGLERGTIVTLNEEREIRRGDVRIRLVPAWRWLLAGKE